MNFEDSTQEEYATASDRATDEKGRFAIGAMTDREIAEEGLMLLRALVDVLEAAGQSPMAAAIMPGLSSMFGR